MQMLTMRYRLFSTVLCVALSIQIFFASFSTVNADDKDASPLIMTPVLFSVQKDDYLSNTALMLAPTNKNNESLISRTLQKPSSAPEAGFGVSIGKAANYEPQVINTSYNHMNKSQTEVDLYSAPVYFSGVYKNDAGVFYGAHVVANIVKSNLSKSGMLQKTGDPNITIAPRLGLVFGYQPSKNYKWVTSLDYLAYKGSPVIQQYGVEDQDALGVNVTYSWLF